MTLMPAIAWKHTYPRALITQIVCCMLVHKFCGGIAQNDIQRGAK